MFSITEENISGLLHALREQSIRVPQVLDLPVVLDDLEDNNIIIAAVEGQADCVVSGDRHLKDLGNYEGIPILSPSEFIARYHIP